MHVFLVSYTLYNHAYCRIVNVWSFSSFYIFSIMGGRGLVVQYHYTSQTPKLWETNTKQTNIILFRFMQSGLLWFDKLQMTLLQKLGQRYRKTYYILILHLLRRTLKHITKYKFQQKWWSKINDEQPLYMHSTN